MTHSRYHFPLPETDQLLHPLTQLDQWTDHLQDPVPGSGIDPISVLTAMELNQAGFKTMKTELQTGDQFTWSNWSSVRELNHSSPIPDGDAGEVATLLTRY